MSRHRSVPLLVLVGLAAACAGGGAVKPAVLPAAPEPAVAPSAAPPAEGTLVPLPGTPEGLVADASTGTLAAAVRDPAAVVLLDLSSGAVRSTVPLIGAARHLAIAKPGGPVLAPDEERDQLHLVLLGDGSQPPDRPVGRQPHDAAPMAGGVLLVGDELADTAHVLRPDGSSIVVPAPVQPGGVAAAPDGSVGLVVGVRGREVAAYRPDGTEIGRAPAGAGPTHVVAGPSTGGMSTFFVSDTNGAAILTYEVTTTKIRLVGTTATPPGPYGLAYDAGRRRLWVASSATNRVEVRDAATLRVLSSRATVQQPNSIAIDERDGSGWIAAATPRGGLHHLPAA